MGNDKEELRRRRRRRRNRKKRRMIEMTPAEKYEQMNAIYNAMKALLVDEDKYEIYDRLAQEYAELAVAGEETPFEGWETCADRSAKCAELASEWKAKLPKNREKLSRTVTTSAKAKEESGEQKKGKGKWIFLGIVLIAIACVICFHVPATRYGIAGLQESLGFDKMAKTSYTKLGDYKDSEDQYIRLEKVAISETEIGETVSFGMDEWYVLDKQDGEALLYRSADYTKHPYNDTREDVTWADCTLRTYLNTNFLENRFSEKERALIQDTTVSTSDNSEYGTDGGEDSVDKVFILDEEQYKTYKKKLSSISRLTRLRTPGMDPSTTAYISNTVKIETYGYPVDKQGVSIRPVMWVSYEE